MTTLTDALRTLRPGINFADIGGTLGQVRWDAPLPNGFVPPTQAEVDAWIAANPPEDLISAAQLLRALAAAERIAIDQATAALAAQGNDLPQRLWQRASYFNRHDPLIAQIGQVLGKDDAALDALWALAKTFS